MARQTFGDFGHRVVVGSFDPNPAHMQVDQSLHGLNIQATWLYGFLRDDEDLTYGVERKFVGSLTSGGFIMTQDGDPGQELNVHKDSGRSARGELRRVIGGVERKWSDPVFQRLPKGTLPEGEQPMTLYWNGAKLAYDEGDILSIEGPSVGNGMQFFVPSFHEPLIYTSTCYWTKGTIQGKTVQGPMWYDNAYWRHGLEWKEYGYFNDLQIMWQVFCNKFDDGTFEWGHLVNGKDGFTPGVVIRGTEVAAMTPTVSAKFELDSAGWPLAAVYDVAGEKYEFEGPVTGRMTEFSESRWANYRAQYGHLRKVGDDRKLVAGLSWLEGFVDRLVDEGLDR
ncbi:MULTISPECIES: hypothetical protein [Mycobacterium]|uniref:Uncharacterized protein n=1 Tax=Mycobacterium kiyosense TaxID=2871094 RepID=A0A9P3UWU4_9MYCO|nr:MULTISPECIES: hypothetical protein [Mycobacterium]BDB43974.1 hypothetical protein IWGMT90018_44200 [Mycobacterium kiyosense]BDE15520.1 hypothetical protein MKCMC460_43800 [Mycobacterium sp. 20KCMC460]GLB81056.1 hypothetical protein SRL2020028_03120 [Mycobacterium kiyosense]GLB91822.1 hypothetical protein SRL2020130_46390 [Mycobacterium kiyosense]GLB93537.1 hypothetical protein SRL2020226_03130 [Mycobacterium kiyosense]